MHPECHGQEAWKYQGPGRRLSEVAWGSWGGQGVEKGGQVGLQGGGAEAAHSQALEAEGCWPQQWWVSG